MEGARNFKQREFYEILFSRSNSSLLRSLAEEPHFQKKIVGEDHSFEIPPSIEVDGIAVPIASVAVDSLTGCSKDSEQFRMLVRFKRIQILASTVIKIAHRSRYTIILNNINRTMRLQNFHLEQTRSSKDTPDDDDGDES